MYKKERNMYNFINKKVTCFSHHQAGYRTLNKKTITYKKKRREKIQVSLKSYETNNYFAWRCMYSDDKIKLDSL
jgi:hypothetical protein